MDISWKTVVIVALAVVFLALVVFMLVTNPSLSRNWSPDQALMPEVEFIDEGTDKARVRIKNVRNIHYRTTRDYDLDYYDLDIAIADVETAWLAIAPFTGFGAAHAFISFGFADGTFMAVSVEVRRKKGKSFGPVKGVFRQFELMYVLASERDVIGVRTNIIKYDVRLYPVSTEKKIIRDVFVDILKRADSLGKEPEFYNTIWNNCTTNIVDHARRFSKKSIPVWSPRYLFPDFFDRIAFRLNIIDSDLSYKETRKHFNITKRALNAGLDSSFSKAIRKGLHTKPGRQ